MSLIPEIKKLIKSEYLRTNITGMENAADFCNKLFGNLTFEKLVGEVMAEASKERFIKGYRISIFLLSPIDVQFNFVRKCSIKNESFLDYYRIYSGYTIDKLTYKSDAYYNDDIKKIRTILDEYIGDKSEVQFVFINKTTDSKLDYDVNMHVGTLKGSYIFHLYNHFDLATSSRYWSEISWINWEDYKNSNESTT